MHESKEELHESPMRPRLTSSSGLQQKPRRCRRSVPGSTASSPSPPSSPPSPSPSASPSRRARRRRASASVPSCRRKTRRDQRCYIVNKQLQAVNGLQRQQGQWEGLRCADFPEDYQGGRAAVEMLLDAAAYQCAEESAVMQQHPSRQ
jgi:hypothetical protein